MNRRGATLIEFLLLLWLIGWVAGGAAWGGVRTPWLVLPGMIGGLVVAVAIPTAVLLPLDRLERRRRRPPCFAGRCAGDDPRWEPLPEARWRCACGDEYVQRDDRFLRLIRGEVELPYMRRDARRRWVPDRGS